MNWRLRVVSTAGDANQKCALELSDMLQATVDAKKQMWEAGDPGRAAAAAALRKTYLISRTAEALSGNKQNQICRIAELWVRPRSFPSVKLPHLGPKNAHGDLMPSAANISETRPNQLLIPTCVHKATTSCNKAEKQRPRAGKNEAGYTPAPHVGVKPQQTRSTSITQSRKMEGSSKGFQQHAYNNGVQSKMCSRFKRANDEIKTARELYRQQINAAKSLRAAQRHLVPAVPSSGCSGLDSS